MTNLKFRYLAIVVALVSLMFIYILGYSIEVSVSNLRIISYCRGLIILLSSLCLSIFFIKKNNQYITENNLKGKSIALQLVIVPYTFALIIILDIVYFYIEPSLSLANSEALIETFEFKGKSSHQVELFKHFPLMVLSFAPTVLGLIFGYLVGILWGQQNLKKINPNPIPLVA